MRRIALIVGFALVATGPAAAACPSLPDNAASNYVENRTALALCQQRELAITTDQAAQNAAIEAQIGNLQIEIERQRIQQQQMLATMQPKI